MWIIFGMGGETGDRDELPPERLKALVDASPELRKILTRKREEAVEKAFTDWAEKRYGPWGTMSYVCVHAGGDGSRSSVTLDGSFGIDDLRELARLIDQEFGGNKPADV